MDRGRLTAKVPPSLRAPRYTTYMSNSSSDVPDLLQLLPKRAILCAVQLPEEDELSFRESLGELTRLASTLGMQVEGEITQKRGSFDSAAYLGPGKLEDLAQLCKREEVPTAILIDHEVSPSQARNVQKRRVWTWCSIELRSSSKFSPSRQEPAGAGAGRTGASGIHGAAAARDAGEWAIACAVASVAKAPASRNELDRLRKLRDRVAELRDELVALEREHKTRSARRQGLRRVALCGYTNAGKSTLFRSLTGAEVYVADKLFATLDTTVRQLHPEPRRTILMSDTVGFIRNLPTKLVASFKTTLDEGTRSRRSLHVVDASDPAALRHVDTTCGVLAGWCSRSSAADRV